MFFFGEGLASVSMMIEGSDGYMSFFGCGIAVFRLN